MKKYDAIIIGAGPAGLTAAIYLRRSNKTAAVFERLVVGGQLAVTPVVENYPGAQKSDGYGIAERMKEQAESFGAQIIMQEVLRVDLKQKTVYTSEETYAADVVIIATGALSKKLGLERENELQGAGVSYCAVCDGNFNRGKVVMLAGNTARAKNDLRYLCGICKKVYYVTPSDYDGDAFDNAEIINGAMPIKLTGMPLSSVTVRSRDGVEREIEVSTLFIDIGFLPQSLLVKDQVSTDETGYILTNENMETDVGGVYAVGDVRKKILRQVVTAAADGATAASAALKVLAKCKKS